MTSTTGWTIFFRDSGFAGDFHHGLNPCFFSKTSNFAGDSHNELDRFFPKTSDFAGDSNHVLDDSFPRQVTSPVTPTTGSILVFQDSDFASDSHHGLDHFFPKTATSQKLIPWVADIEAVVYRL